MYPSELITRFGIQLKGIDPAKRRTYKKVGAATPGVCFGTRIFWSDFGAGWVLLASTWSLHDPLKWVNDPIFQGSEGDSR